MRARIEPLHTLSLAKEYMKPPVMLTIMNWHICRLIGL